MSGGFHDVQVSPRWVDVDSGRPARVEGFIFKARAVKGARRQGTLPRE